MAKLWPMRCEQLCYCGFWDRSLKGTPLSPSFLFADWNGRVMAGALSFIWVHEDAGSAQELSSRLLDRAGSPRTL